MPGHRTLVSGDVHEPKHITNSTAADAGKVITPLSGGTSELRKLTPAEVGIVYAYGEIDVDAETASFAVAAATDSTLHTGSDYILLNSARVPTTEGETFDMTYDGVNNTLTINTSGVYRIGGWVNAKSDVNNTKIGVKYTANGTPTGGALITDLAAIDRTENLSGFGLVTLTAGTVIGISLAADKAATITVSDMRLNLELIRQV